MNKSELVVKVAKKSEVSQATVNAVISATLDAVKEAIREGEPVQLVGFGTFDRKWADERMGRNPSTGEEKVVPAHFTPKFTFGKQFKDEIKQVKK